MTIENTPEIYYISFHDPQNVSPEYNFTHEKIIEKALLNFQRNELDLTSDLIVFDGRGEFANLNFSQYYFQKLCFIATYIASKYQKCVTLGYAYEENGFVNVKVALRKKGEFIYDDITIINPDAENVDAQILIDTVEEFHNKNKKPYILAQKK